MYDKYVVIADMSEGYLIQFLTVAYDWLTFCRQEPFEPAARPDVNAVVSPLKTQRPFQKRRALEIGIVLDGSRVLDGLGRSTTSFRESSFRTI